MKFYLAAALLLFSTIIFAQKNCKTNLDSVFITSPGTYWLQLSNSFGCKGKESFITVDKQCTTAIYFPNAFSPNSDNNNDIFKPGVYGVIEYYHLQVYNRYGEKVFESNDWKKGWDGSFNGKKQGIGAYIWFCSYKLKTLGAETQKGTVLLLR